VKKVKAGFQDLKKKIYSVKDSLNSLSPSKREINSFTFLVLGWRYSSEKIALKMVQPSIFSRY